jgi:hypothetical protein
MLDWWSETESAILGSLGSAGPMSPEDVARRIGISESETTAFLCMLARENKISIRLVAVKEAPADRSPRGSARPREKARARREPAHAGGR